MQMHSTKPLNENAPVGAGRPATAPDYRQNSDIRRTRTIVLIILGIELVFAVFYFVQRSIYLHRYYDIPVAIRDEKLAGNYIVSLVVAGLILVYISIFIFVVVRYHRHGILIFAWLGAINLIFKLIVIILGIIGIVILSRETHIEGAITTTVIVVIFAVIDWIISILLIVFSFKLAKLLKMQEVYQLV